MFIDDKELEFSFNNMFCYLHNEKPRREDYLMLIREMLYCFYPSETDDDGKKLLYEDLDNIQGLVDRNYRRRNRVPSRRFIELFNKALDEKKDSDDCVRRMFNLKVKVKYGRQRIEWLNIESTTKKNKAKNIIKAFFEENVFDDSKYDTTVKKFVKYLSKEYATDKEAIFWILLLSLFPKNTDKLDVLINYWKVSNLWKSAFEEPAVAPTVSDKTPQPTQIKKLALDGVNKFLNSLLDENLGITADTLNESIDKRNLRFRKPLRKRKLSTKIHFSRIRRAKRRLPEKPFLVDISTPKDDENFQSALSDVLEIFENNEYRTILKLLVFFPMNKIRAQALNNVPGVSKTIIQCLRKKGIILSLGNFYVLDYSYEIIFEYIKKISNNFTKVYVFENLSFLCSDYNIGEWKDLLRCLMITHRDILRNNEKKFLLSKIDFSDDSKELKKIFEQGGKRYA